MTSPLGMNTTVQDFNLNTVTPLDTITFYNFNPNPAFPMSPAPNNTSTNVNYPINTPPHIQPHIQTQPTTTPFENPILPPQMMVNTHPVIPRNPTDVRVIPVGGNINTNNWGNNSSSSSSGSEDSGDESKPRKKKKAAKKVLPKKQTGNKNRISIGDVKLFDNATGELLDFTLSGCKLDKGKNMTMKQVRDMIKTYTKKYGLRKTDVSLYVNKKKEPIELLQRKIKAKRKTKSKK